MAINIFTNCSPIALGCFLYTDSGLTTPVSNGVYSDGINTFTVTGGAGEITATGSCPVTSTTTTTSTTTGASALVSVRFDNISGAACTGAFFNLWVPVGTSTPFPTGTILYSDAGLTSTFTTSSYNFVVQEISGSTSGQTIFQFDFTTGTVGTSVGSCP